MRSIFSKEKLERENGFFSFIVSSVMYQHLNKVHIANQVCLFDIPP